MSGGQDTARTLSGLFEQSTRLGLALPKPKREPPFSLRLSADERAYLLNKANGQPLGSYIKTCLFDGRTVRKGRRGRSRLDDQKIALVLSELGASRLSSNVNQLAKAVNMGTLDVSEEVERELLEACAAILAMRDMLVSALGLKSERGP